MNSLVQTLKGKIGPVPIWVLVLVLSGLAFWWIKRSSSAATTDTQDEAKGGDTLDTGDLANGLPIQQYVTYVSVPGQTTGATTTTPTTGTTPPTAGGNKGPVVTPTGPVGGVKRPPTVPVRPLPSKTNTISYAVKSGDNLTRIASRYGIPESVLYNSNKTLIENTARQHGYKSSDSGHWIFPGEKLVIPA